MQYDLTKSCCLNCPSSFSLAADDPYDDGSVTDYDRLVCMNKHKLVDEDACCDAHPDWRQE